MNIKRSHRPIIIGRKGAIATNHPIASQAGLDILRSGGNAVDAAVAISLTLGVVEPHMSGLGGDGFYHTFNPVSHRAQGCVYNGSGLPSEALAAAQQQELPLHGPLSVSVPGSLGALEAMHRREGSMPWAALCQHAIDAADDGFGVTFSYKRFAERNAHKLREDRSSKEIYLRSGDAPAVGSYVRQDKLAETLRAIAVDGAESFYRGELSRRIVSDFKNAGVPISAADLGAYEPQIQSPISTNYRGYEVRQVPPNSTGFVHLQTLKILEQFDLASFGHLSAASIHLMVEAKKLAFLDRERYASDPRVRSVPVEELLEARHIEHLAAQIDLSTAADIDLRRLEVNGPTGRPRSGGNTTYFCVTDSSGRAVSAIQSLNNAFGSAVTLPGTGILLNNRMTCWHLASDHPNRLTVGKRVRHTMNAPMILKDGAIWALFGTPGADDQVQTNLQASAALVDFELDPQYVAEATRWSSDQSGQEANWPHGGTNSLTIEEGLDASVMRELGRLGHQLQTVPALEGPCSLACIRALHTHDGPVFMAGSDPRRDGWAASF
ncbi:Gamma-glutamyltranspeptidase [Paraburkholderia caribensis]|uniref:gamma-glutamyltransferase n=1 Tax=Paraburkholderia caribensis TaxID=75105 RepID=UPI001CB4EEFB|nr:gamma-glutamyltransferase [Paraburkholderia caribensis]CAG9219647.1 Gamma-glutamyltranspeptidase [Paraburkholderia caribensis]